MKKLVLAGMLTAVMLAAVLAAGCMIPMTPSSTPTPSPGTTTTAQNVSQYLTTMMQQRNFTMMMAFSLQRNTQAGIAVYNGTASDQNGTYAVSVQAWNTSQAAQAQFAAMRTTFMRQGYSPVQETSTMWSGFNASTGKGVAVEYGYSPLMPNYVMIITGGTTGHGTFQQLMWLHVWSVMHTPGANGGMGPYMGQGMDATTRDAMRQQMQEHMGSGFSTWMMSGR